MKLVLFVLLLIVLTTTAFGQDGRWQNGLIRIQYVDGVDIDAVTTALVSLDSRKAAGVGAGASWMTIVDPDGRERMGELLETARDFWNTKIPDPRLQVNIMLELGVDIDTAIRELEVLPEVESASRVPIFITASLARGGGTHNYQDDQTYLKPQYWDYLKSGIDALWAWDNNITGEGVIVCDVEFGFYIHCDLPDFHIINPWPSGVPVNAFSHGTATTGEVVAMDNRWGTTGIAHGSTMYFSSVFHASPEPQGFVMDAAMSILQALNLDEVDVLPIGSIMMLELQVPGPHYDHGNDTEYGLVPVEWWPSAFHAIQIAVANGIVVCEAAGNGSQNLDDDIYGVGNYNHWPFLPGPSHDSGAIIVGAGDSGYMGGDPQSVLEVSNRGRRVNVQGHGNNVVTTAGSTVDDCLFYEANPGFTGTSSATPIVAGAAALIQSEWQKGNQPLTSVQMRRLLSSTGTLQSGPDETNNIGPLPNVKAAIEQLQSPEIGACCINGACVPTTLDGCYSASGTYAGDGVDCSEANCPTNCAGDVIPDGVIDINDVLFILDKFGNICP